MAKRKAKTSHESWRNRIVGSGFEDPEQMLANPKNFRIHPKHQQDALSGVLDEIGWVQQVIVNQRTQHVIDGHLRVSLAISRGEKRVPVIYVDLSEEEEALILATLDPLAALAATDKEQLALLLAEVVSGDGAVQEMLSNLAVEHGLIEAQPIEKSSSEKSATCPECGHSFALAA